MTKTERRAVVIVSRALCVPSLIAAALYVSLNVFIVFSSAYCCGNPWDDFPWLSLMTAFAICMVVAVAGIILRRVVAQPTGAQHALWVAAGIEWCGALCFGIGSAGSSFSVSSAFGGGEVMFLLEMLGMLASVAALLTAVGGPVTIWAGPAPARAAALAPGLAAGEEPVVVLRGPADGIH